jgi:hypothetical protein
MWHSIAMRVGSGSSFISWSSKLPKIIASSASNANAINNIFSIWGWITRSAARDFDEEKSDQ